MAQRGAGRGIGQSALDRPQDSQRESLVRYFRVGAVGQRQGRRAAVPAPNTFSQEWANYIAVWIKRAGDHTLRISMETVGKVLAKERDKLRGRLQVRARARDGGAAQRIFAGPARRGAEHAKDQGGTVEPAERAERVMR